MARFGSTRPVRREEYGSQHQEPSEGHPEGVPEFPEALPGSHHYAGKDATPVRHELDVGPADPYYGTGGMAHGVAVRPSHGGRPAPRPEEQQQLRETRQLIEEETAALDPVPVVIVEPRAGARPLLRAVLQQRTVPAPGADPFLLVPRDPARTSVRLLNESPIVPSVQADNTITNPGLGATITSIVLPPGVWMIGWTVELAGTVTAADANNMQLVLPAQSLNAAYPGQTGTFPQQAVEVTLTATTTISVKAIAAASGASAVYGAQVAAIPAGSNAPVRMTMDATLSGGALLPAGMTSYLEIDTQDAIYAYCPAAGPALVSMISQYQVAKGT